MPAGPADGTEGVAPAWQEAAAAARKFSQVQAVGLRSLVRWRIYEENRADSGWDLSYIRLDDRRPVSILRSRFAERQGQLSPDGRYLACVSTESGQQDVYVVTFPDASRRWTISSQGGASPRWSRDGRELLFVDSQGMLMSVPVTTGGAFQPDIPKPLFVLDGVSTDGLSYAVGRDGRVLVVRPNERTARLGLSVVTNLPQVV